MVTTARRKLIVSSINTPDQIENFTGKATVKYDNGTYTGYFENGLQQ
ncbi:MAG: hypothetical protein WCL18_08655 [bacterium]